MPGPGDVTRLLQRWKVDGDRQAEGELFALVESELRGVAARALQRETGLSHKIEPRELVNEAYIRLEQYAIETPNRGPFFTLMAKAMRQCLLDLARRGRRDKRPPSHLRLVDTDAVNAVEVPAEIAPIDFYNSLDALRAINARQADAIELRVVGLSNDEIAHELRVSTATVKRDLAEARVFLAFRLKLPAGSMGA